MLSQIIFRNKIRVAINFNEKCCHLVALKKVAPNRYQLLAQKSCSYNGTTEQLIALLKEAKTALFADTNLSQKIWHKVKIITALKSDEVAQKIITINAKLKPKTLRNLLALNLEKQLELKPENSYFDYRIIDDNKIEVIAVTQETMSKTLHPLQAAGLTPDIVDLDTYATTRITKYLNKNKDAPFAHYLKDEQLLITYGLAMMEL